METTNKETQTNEIPENLTPQQALAILVQGVQFAQTKGVYSLTDAELISKSVRVFTSQAEGEEGVTPAPEAVPEPSKSDTVGDPIGSTPDETVEEIAVEQDEQDIPVEDDQSSDVSEEKASEVPAEPPAA